jgi:hypothetical protein
VSRRRLVGVAATLLVVALGAAAVALLVVDDHHNTSVRVTQLAAAAALVIAALGGFAVVAAADVLAHRSHRSTPAGNPAPPLQADGAGHPVGLWVQLTGEGQRPFLVISAERDNATFLVARDDEQAQWVPKDRIESWAVRTPD